MVIGKRPTGFRAFTVIWSGQLLSALGTRMTNFALGIWVWERTGRASDLALMTFSAFFATAVFSPVAGSLIDRWSRRLTIVLSDVGSAVATAAILVMFAAGSGSVWVLYAINAAIGAALAFQAPAYQAAISVMMEKGTYPRANAMLSLTQSVPAIFAPSAAAALLAVVDIKVILLVDVLTYVAAIATVFAVDLPARSADPAEPGRGLWQDSLFGFRYILRRPALLRLEAILFAVFVFGVMGWLLLTPMVMARTGDSQTQVGVVQSIGAVGGVAGSALVSVLPPPKRKALRMLLGILAFSLLGRVLLGFGHSLPLWAVGWCCAWASMPFFLGYGQAIWQEKVAPAVQGRVFAARNMFESLATPIALGVSGPLADYVFEPAMRPGGALAGTFGGLVGTGPGSGMALMFVLTGLIGVGVALIGFASPLVRNVETLIPDHDAAEAPERDRAAPQPALTGD
jgi:MFS family permease